MIDFDLTLFGDDAATRLPGLHKVSDVTLKRGVVEADVPAHTPEWTNPTGSDPGMVSIFLDDFAL